MRNTIKGLLLVLALIMAITLSLVSCGDEEVCTEHKDEDANGYCDICETPVEPPAPVCEHRDENADYECDKCGIDFFPECYDHINENDNAFCDICGEDLPINITFKISDQNGVVISGIGLTVTDSDGEGVSGVTNADGEAVFSLLVGSYRVSYDEETVPEGHIAYASSVAITEDSDIVALEILNNIPNGTMERPFVIDPELEFNSVSHLGGEKFFYIVPHGGSRIISFVGSDYEVVYYVKGDDEYTLNPYTPDNEGRITFRFTETDIKTPSLFTIENKSSAEQEIGVELKSEPGTMAKPYEIADITSPVVSEGTMDKTVYYKWIATESGELKIYSPIEYYSIRIGSTEAVLLIKNDATDGLFGVYSAITPEGAITVEILDGTICVLESEIASILAGDEYKYEIATNGKFVIKDIVTEVEIEPFAISPAGRVVTVTNNRNSSQQRIEENADEVHILVQEGDEIVIAIYTSFDMNVEFKLEY